MRGPSSELRRRDVLARACAVVRCDEAASTRRARACLRRGEVRCGEMEMAVLMKYICYERSHARAHLILFEHAGFGRKGSVSSLEAAPLFRLSRLCYSRRGRVRRIHSLGTRTRRQSRYTSPALRLHVGYT